ncbi:MAG: hypothetical protein HC767_10760, partial [Akkermansiaceae bacterium]|nr:hypothetical protein [Akkermansiaceae bacterium]
DTAEPSAATTQESAMTPVLQGAHERLEVLLRVNSSADFSTQGQCAPPEKVLCSIHSNEVCVVKVEVVEEVALVLQIPLVDVGAQQQGEAVDGGTEATTHVATDGFAKLARSFSHRDSEVAVHDSGAY